MASFRIEKQKSESKLWFRGILKKPSWLLLTALMLCAVSITPANANTKFTQNLQLSAFSPNTSSLSDKQKSEIGNLVFSAEHRVESLTCTGIAANSKNSSLTQAKKLASVACMAAKKMDSSIEIKVATKVSGLKSLARKVLLRASLIRIEPPLKVPVIPTSSLSRVINSALQPNSPTYSPFTIVSEPTSLSAKNQYLVDKFTQHLGWASRLGMLITRELVVVYPNTEAWMNNEIQKLCSSRYNLPLGGYAIWQDCGTKSVVTRPNADFESSPKESLESQHGLIHEALHQWQRETVPKYYGNGDYPKWVWEGGVQALSRYIFWLNSDRTQTPDALLVDWFTTYRSDLRQSCIGVNIREMVPNKAWPDKANCAYSKGQVAVDLFVETYGLEKFLMIFKAPKQRGMSDFPSVFQSVTGSNLEDFYDKVDREIALRGWR